jgi:hypothetical protein
MDMTGYFQACVRAALFIQHARRIVTSFVTPLAPPHFSTLSHKRHDFREKLLNIKCAFWFSILPSSKTYLILRRISRDTIKNVKRPSCKVPIILVGFFMKLEFSRQIFEKVSNIKFHQNSSSGSRVVPCGQTDTDRQTDRQTNITKLIVAFRNFTNAPKTRIVEIWTLTTAIQTLWDMML